jgi:hypothetical protein
MQADTSGTKAGFVLSLASARWTSAVLRRRISACRSRGRLADRLRRVASAISAKVVGRNLDF